VVVKAVQRLVAPLKRRVLLMVGRAVVERVYDDLKCQGLQVSLLNGEVRDKVEHFQPYGFTSHPPPGSEGVFLAVGGNRSHGSDHPFEQGKGEDGGRHHFSVLAFFDIVDGDAGLC
jgi:phage gp45-like